MCRLFAYVHGGSPRSMAEALDASILDQYRLLAEVHRDGWGMATAGPEGRSFYLSNKSAAGDAAMFAALASQAQNSVIIHERLASPGIGLVLDNQQPFMSGGIAFGHNGTIGNADGNIVDAPQSYREALGLARSTTRSDSKLYGELFVHRLGRERRAEAASSPNPEELGRALSETIRLLRRDYPDSSYNNVIQTPDYTAITRAHADAPVCGRGLRRIYEAAGWPDRIDSYFTILYTSIAHPDGSVSGVASSSGYRASDGWTELENNTVLLFSHKDASPRLMRLDA
jgi:predicted glutamine amidotransferase